MSYIDGTSNKLFYTLVLGGVFLLTAAGVFAAYSFMPNPGHGGDVVWIEIDNTEMSLQQAIDSDLATVSYVDSEIDALNYSLVQQDCYEKTISSGNGWRNLRCDNADEFITGIDIYDDDDDWDDIDIFRIHCCRVGLES